jgi:hypothetical protein
LVVSFPNVLSDPNATVPFEEWMERDYFAEVLHALALGMGPKFESYTFCLFSCNGGDRRPATADNPRLDNKVLLYLSDEHGTVPSELSGHYTAIFKAYLRTDVDRENIFPLSLGCVNGVKMFPIIPVAERTLDVFFSGNLNTNRLTLYKEFTPLRLLPDDLVEFCFRVNSVRRLAPRVLGTNFSGGFESAHIQFTRTFGDGLSREDYAAKLSVAKIALCPTGFHSTETFRHFEATRAGCIVISMPLPDTTLYRGAPIVQVESWRNGLEKARELLTNMSALEETQREILAWWKSHWSPEATARFIQTKLSQLAG